MVFLLVFVWMLTALLGGFAAARFYRKSAADVSSGQSNALVVFWVTFIVIFVFLAAFAYTLSSSARHPKGSPSVSAGVYPIAADAQDIWPKAGETVKVKIYPDCWSGWINLPPDAYVAINFPGEHEYLFVTGERILGKDKTTRWLGEVPHCSFRIKGTAGEATITVQADQTKQNPVSYY